MVRIPFSSHRTDRNNTSGTNGFSNGGTGTTLPTSTSTSSRISLPYRLSSHRRNWAIWFGLFVFDGSILPIILFYSLWYGSSLSRWTIFALITSLSFWTSYHKWFSRGWRLVKKDPKYRPLGGGRWWFDCSYYVLSLALLVVIVELVAATSTKKVKVGVIAMAPPSVLYVVAAFMLGQNCMHVLGMRAMWTISSVKRGESVPPPLFTVMEDVFAVDGCHEGRSAREAMLAMYEGNARLRSTLVWWSWFWGFACLAAAVAMSVVVGVAKQTTCFGVTYGVCFPFIVLMSLITAWWMERQDSRGAFSVSASDLKTAQGMEMQNGTARPG